MTPSQLLPPVNPSEAVAIADLLFRLLQGKPWSPDLRGKLESSLPTLKLEKLKTLAHTLAPDPGHSATFYLVIETGEAHWLLHIAPASAATAPLFPNPILLARVRPSGEREIIINAIPLAPNMQSVVMGLHPHLHARPTSLHSLHSKPAESIEPDFFKSFPKRPNLLPALRTTNPSWQIYLPVLLSTWRDGFVTILEKLHTPPTASEAGPFSRFSFLLDDPRNARAVANWDQALKNTLHRAYDLELDLSQHDTLDLDHLHTLLDNIKLLGTTIQSVELSSHLHIPAFAMALQSRQIGLTLAAPEPGPTINGLRTHWKL
jgi:hypothetical protein